LPNPPKWAKLKLGVSLTLDKGWGQRQAVREHLSIRNIAWRTNPRSGLVAYLIFGE
jgi:hypothetical protein